MHSIFLNAVLGRLFFFKPLTDTRLWFLPETRSISSSWKDVMSGRFLMLFASANAVNTKPTSSGLCPQSPDSQTVFTLSLHLVESRNLSQPTIPAHRQPTSTSSSLSVAGPLWIRVVLFPAPERLLPCGIANNTSDFFSHRTSFHLKLIFAISIHNTLTQKCSFPKWKHFSLFSQADFQIESHCPSMTSIPHKQDKPLAWHLMTNISFFQFPLWRYY